MARLSIPDEPTFVTFTVTSATTEFPFTFAIFGKEDLTVLVNGLVQAQSSFTFSGSLLEKGAYQGGSVFMNTPVEPDDGDASATVRIERNVRAARASQFGAVSSVPVSAIDAAFNRVTATQQDYNRRLAEVGDISDSLQVVADALVTIETGVAASETARSEAEAAAGEVAALIPTLTDAVAAVSGDIAAAQAAAEAAQEDADTAIAGLADKADTTDVDAALDLKADLTLLGAVGGIATLDSNGLVPSSQLPSSGSFKGTWNATTNTPTITSGTGLNGDFYRVATAGTTTIDGISSWAVGDEVRFNDTLDVWQKIPTNAAVSSVAGRTGAVVLTASDAGAVAIDGSNLSSGQKTTLRTALGLGVAATKDFAVSGGVAAHDDPRFGATGADIFPESYGAVGNGSTNDYAALNAAAQAAATVGKRLWLSRNYRCNSSITINNKDFSIAGPGGLFGMITWGTNCGFTFSAPAATVTTTRRLTMRGIAMRTTNQSTRPVVRVEYAAGGSGSTATSVVMEDVDIGGVDYDDGFTYAVDCFNVRSAVFRDVRIEGDRANAPQNSLAGMRFDGASDPTELKLYNVNVFFVRDGLKIQGNGEGYYIHQYTAVGVDYGVNYASTAGDPLLMVTDSHINARKGSIKATNNFLSTIRGNHFYFDDTSSCIGIELDNNSGIDTQTVITDNIFFNFGITNSTAISLDGSAAAADHVFIQGNSFNGTAAWGKAIWLKSNCNGSYVGPNFYISCTVTVDDDGTGNTIADGGTAGLDPTWVTLTPNSATPSLTAGFKNLFTANTSARTITDFLGAPYDGFEFTLLVNDTNTTIQHNAGLLLKGAVNISPANGAVLHFIRQGSVWREVGR